MKACDRHEEEIKAGGNPAREIQHCPKCRKIRQEAMKASNK